VSWERKRLLVTVKAAPEPSKKYSDSVCTAGITPEGEFIRLYPVPFQVFRTGPRFKKFDWIEVECQPSTGEKLSRKESYKIRPHTLKIIDRSLSSTPVDWSGRAKALARVPRLSIEELEEAFRTERTSLGLVRVQELSKFYKTSEADEDVLESERAFQMVFGDDGGTKLQSALRQVPHVFKYRFSCAKAGVTCRGHDTTCEDWELFESNRSWRLRYPNAEERWGKLHYRFYTWLKERDLQFFVGTHSLYPVWMIVGLYYPPQSISG
jgi:hypothetical protein